MKPIVELEECLRDSPKFRAAVEENEELTEQLETKLEKLVRLCNCMVDSGKTYLNSKAFFINGIWELVTYFKGDTAVVNPLSKLIHAMTEINKYQSILIDQAQRSIIKNLNDFIKTDIRKTKDCKRYFEKISDDFDNALIRHSQVPKSKPHECEEVGNLLTSTRSIFQHSALDYAAQLSVLQSKKRFEILDTLLTMMHAYTTYFHQGWDLIQDFDPFLKQVAVTLTKLKEETTALEKNVEGRHVLVTQKDMIPVLVRNEQSENSIRQEGYLFKRTSNAFKTWNRRWFIIQNNQLVYRKRSRECIITIMEEDLRLCSVKPATEIDRRFCFEVLSPSKSHILQADSEEACQQWITALQAGINAALNHTLHADSRSEDVEFLKNPMKQEPQQDKTIVKDGQLPISKPLKAHSQILSIPGNDWCCDCRSPEPRWASINLGITLCIECSGIHRSLGVHVSKVRSLTLDAWEPELLKVMAELGNVVVNGIYEANVDEKIAVRATSDCSRNIRETWIKAKYVKKAFVPSLLGSIPTSNEEHIQGMPRRWSVCKRNRRQRAFQVIQDHSKSSSQYLSVPNGGLSAPSGGQKSSTESSSRTHDQMKSLSASHAAEVTVVSRESEPLNCENQSVFGIQSKESKTNNDSQSVIDSENKNNTDDEEQIVTVGENEGDKINSEEQSVTVSENQYKANSNEELNKEMQTIGDNIASAEKESPSFELGYFNGDVLVFGSAVEQEVPHIAGIELDSADESLSPDDDTDEMMEDDISKLHPSLLLYRAAAVHNLPVMCQAQSMGGDSNWVNLEDKGRLPLHQAIISGSIMACEYLLLNGAKVNNMDEEGKTALHLATELGHTGQVCQLLKRGADQHAMDKTGNNALAIAINDANADIVTLLRLAKLNEEIRRDEFGNSGDETFNEVVRDFSHMASHNPEKLRRLPSLAE
ncbi:arf-GAP with coiled-coil, ANK repeat and PH domain-containing protein 2-like isoform X2 [Limulus polyphemus]|uniref:Arf-GAP with coiled-coil, ANK repeat and PH domain-containing protein 2-like isoform X2 n=1 Tax=Limulus polyphemus TaxID=6850 RepID=A0ABM1BEZ4_LIMPO|nr:arf-GAP with coiled-coil, ANK repeat and PH domain-containing protein 2-like isoform X2 [Limulus polyphemus]